IEDGYPLLHESLPRLADDPSPLVKAVMSRSLPTMDGPGRFDTVDRVMALQGVPIFSDIDPEDLERIAEFASERRYQPEEAIYRYGAEGDEILVIISGEVEIRRPNGE